MGGYLIVRLELIDTENMDADIHESIGVNLFIKHAASVVGFKESKEYDE